MDVGHFSYLLAGDGPQHVKVASDRLELLAKTAAKRFVEEGMKLTPTIMKIAQEEELNANQIERVCEMANIATHQALWSKTAQKDSVAFPLAEAKTIVAALGKQAACGGPPQSSSGSSIEADYAGPPTGLPLAGPSLVSMMGADPAAVHNGMTEVPEKKQIIIVLQKKASARQDLQDRILLNGMQLESLEKQAYNTVKQTILGGETFRRVFEAACGAGLGKVACEYLPKFQDRLLKEAHGSERLRLEKHAIAMAPEDLISDDMGNVSIVNGAHPVLVSLDTVQKKTGEIKNGLRDLLRIDDEVKVYHQRLRDLS